MLCREKWGANVACDGLGAHDELGDFHLHKEPFQDRTSKSKQERRLLSHSKRQLNIQRQILQSY